MTEVVVRPSEAAPRLGRTFTPGEGGVTPAIRPRLDTVGPLDPRLLGRLGGARAALAVDVVLGLLVTAAVVTQAFLFADVVAATFRGGTMAAASPEILVMAAVLVLRSLFAAAFEVVGRRAAAGVMSQLRLSLVERRLPGAPLGGDGAEAGEVATAAVQGVQALEVYFARYLPQVVLAVLLPAAVLASTVALDPTSAAIMLVTLPMVPVFMLLIGRATAARTRSRWQALARLSNYFADVIRGLPTLRAFNRGPAQAEGIAAASEAYRATTMQVLRVSFLSGAVLDLVATIATALVAVTLGVRLVDGRIGLEPALTVLLLTPEVYAPLRALAAQFHASGDGLAAAERILELIDACPPARSGTGAPSPSWQSVRLHGVTVTNASRPGPVLADFELVVRRGEIVALVGPSGAGKSTVASLLLGLRSPDSGAVMVDGADLSTLDLPEWRRQVSWLPQRPTLFRGTVRANIALGDPGAPLDAVEHAARSAGADDFVPDLRYGYDTRVGEAGRGLSAGETRRIALARALLRDAPLLILDEPTANLDADSAASIARAVRRIAADRAVLLIEHRPQLARAADRIVRIENGRAAEVRP